MAKVICDRADCVHRSNRPMRKWKYADGRKCYGCKLDTVTIILISDPDGDVEVLIGRKEMAHCSNYEPGQTVLPEFERD